jgi:hypothetical protein
MGLLLLAFLVRLYHLEAQSIWWDEAISLHLATSNLVELLIDRAMHVHPPLYFLLLKGWVALTGVSAFVVRYFSVWFSVLLVPATYVLGCRFGDRRTGLLGGLLVALSPLYIIYSQEARVYAVLPLFYVALLILMERLVSQREPRPRSDWALLSTVEIVGVHLHYVFLFAIAYVRLLLATHLWRHRREQRRWLASLAAVALACTPWAMAVLLNWRSVLSDVGSGDPFVKPVPLDYLARLLWTFQWSGLTGAWGYPPLRIAAFVLAVLFLVVLGVLFSRVRTRRTTFGLLAHWLVPLGVSVMMWVAKPLSHPRYVALFAVALLLFCAWAVMQLGRGTRLEKGLAVLLALAILSSATISLHAYAFNREFAKDDVRALAAWLEEKAAGGDLIVAPWRDWSLDYAYSGAVPIVRPNPAEGNNVWDELTGETAAGDRVFLVGYSRATQDHRRVLPFALETAGRLVERRSFKGLRLRVYRLDQAVASPELLPIDGRFGSLHLVGRWIEQDVPANTAVGVGLRWRLEEPSDAQLHVALQLRDGNGWTWDTADDWLLNEAGQSTDQWKVGQEVTTYHILSLPPGTPPLSYTLGVRVYSRREQVIQPVSVLDRAGNPKGQSLNVGTTSLNPPLVDQGDPYDQAERVPLWESPVEFREGLILKGASLDRQTADPGQSVFVTLSWEKKDATSSGLQATLGMQRGGETLATETKLVGGCYPVQRWAIGQMVVEHRRLVIPGDVEEGPVRFVIEVGSQQVEVGEVEVGASVHRFTPPPMTHRVDVRFGDVAELLGYDLVQTEFAVGEPIQVVLYWRALDEANEADYKVFSHLLAVDGHLVGQHDGRPAGDTRPTLGWLPGEIIADPHTMVFRETYTGSVRVEVGLYEANSLDRVIVADGETFVLLPSELTIAEQ